MRATAPVGRYRKRIVKGPIVKTLLWLGAPLVVVQLIQVSYNVADAFWLSMYSDVALAIPRQAWPPFLFFNAISMALSSANLALISQYVGARDFEGASEAASKFFTASTVAGLALGGAYFTLRPLIFGGLIKVPGEIYKQVMSYAGVMSAVAALSYVVTAYSTILQGLGDTRRPALINALCLLFNIALDPLLIFGVGPLPRLGVLGAAVTDLMGNALNAVALALAIERAFPDLRVRLTRSMDSGWILANLRIGLPILALVLSNSTAKMLQLRLVNTFGVAAATAYSLGFVAMDLSDAALRGLARAAAIIVGQSLGAGLYGRAREAALKASALIFTATLAGASTLYAFRSLLISIFVEDPAIHAEAMKLLGVLLWSLPFFGIMLTAMFVGRGSGHTLPPTLIGIARLWGFWVGLGYLLALQLGYGSTGVWTAMALGNIATGLISLAWLRYGGWARPVIRPRKPLPTALHEHSSPRATTPPSHVKAADA
ncbi:MAG: MATE family efflux transporter [Thermoprotei archaeon]|nr:MAG: MATE family efflux transporter [Thermoprotei archaeon]RLE96384.1 MAG: MATE family efflux transporter [Thermoprotei archaeon]